MSFVVAYNGDDAVSIESTDGGEGAKDNARGLRIFLAAKDGDLEGLRSVLSLADGKSFFHPPPIAQIIRKLKLIDV